MNPHFSHFSPFSPLAILSFAFSLFSHRGQRGKFAGNVSPHPSVPHRTNSFAGLIAPCLGVAGFSFRHFVQVQVSESNPIKCPHVEQDAPLSCVSYTMPQAQISLPGSSFP